VIRIGNMIKKILPPAKLIPNAIPSFLIYVKSSKEGITGNES
jgi:hypothetical protein